MRVYRCISAREITNFYKGRNDRQALVKGQNTHKYNEEKCIHFFRYSQSAEYFKKSIWTEMNPLDRYVLFMTANIPNEILREHIGYGFYNSDGIKIKHPGYIPLPEYAIPESKFNVEYIVEINDIINPKLVSNDKEYNKYLKLLDTLYFKYKDYSQIGKKLSISNLEKILEIKDDGRTEEQILADEIDEMTKIFSSEDFFR